MKIGGISNQNFGHIKLSVDSYWQLFNQAKSNDIKDIMDMPLKGYDCGYMTYDKSSGNYLIKGIDFKTYKDISVSATPLNAETCIFLGPYPTIDTVRTAITEYNRHAE